jgi:hypothetical protein
MSVRTVLNSAIEDGPASIDTFTDRRASLEKGPLIDNEKAGHMGGALLKGQVLRLSQAAIKSACQTLGTNRVSANTIRQLAFNFQLYARIRK